MSDKFWGWALGNRKNDGEYYEEEDLEWVTGVLPLIAFRDLTKPAYPVPAKFAMYQESDPVEACFRMTYLIDFLHVHDPFGECVAYKALNDIDPGFKKLRAFSRFYLQSLAKDSGIFPLEEWKNLDYLLGWVLANAFFRLNRVPDLIAEEALSVVGTNHLEYYLMFFRENKSLGEIRKQRLRDNEPRCWLGGSSLLKFS